MSKVTRASKQVKKVFHPSVIRTTMKAGGASTGPPIGPTIGQRGLPIVKFVEDFNNLTKDIKPGTPIPTRIHVDGKKFTIQLLEPESSYLIMQAAGISKGSRSMKDFPVGKITHKHIYEIAKVKLEQENVKIRNMPLKEMCELLAEQAYRLGVDVVRNIDPEEYDAFLTSKEEEEAEFQRKKEEDALAKRKKMIGKE
uniref:Large ribosomal subunit protein uL11m n=1 Tax=Ciona intestinalis TaxID=7719 RepID=F7AUH4_CIOIN|nr:39S ribosomal protein L11, mitochondrial-like [Ciona intestinalis]|eukprot:XP_002129028.1 39S ribosomal protein L11, mitochondrial-like [Ciona intestinalis]